MLVNDELHQKLLEYLYGLLSDTESKDIAEKISSDPDVARAYTLARRDVEPDVQGNMRLVDSETGQLSEIFADGPSLDRYGKAFARHQQNWFQACRQVGATMTTLVADTLVKDWQLPDLVAADILKVI